MECFLPCAALFLLTMTRGALVFDFSSSSACAPLVKNTNAGPVPITDNMRFELSVTLNSRPTTSVDIIDISKSDGSIWMPTVMLKTSYTGFYVSHETSSGTRTYDTGSELPLCTPISLVIEVTQSYYIITVDGTVVVSEGGFPRHSLFATGFNVYISDPWLTAADAIVHSLKIYDDVISPAPTNLLVNVVDPVVLTQSNQIATINVPNNVQVDLQVLVHSAPTNWANIMHIGTVDGNLHNRYPSMWVTPDSAVDGADLVGFSVGASTPNDYNYQQTLGGAITADTTYAISVRVTQSSYELWLNGEMLVQDLAYPGHETPTNIGVYLSAPLQPAADMTVLSLQVYDYIKGSASAPGLPVWPIQQPQTQPHQHPLQAPKAPAAWPQLRHVSWWLYPLYLALLVVSVYWVLSKIRLAEQKQRASKTTNHAYGGITGTDSQSQEL